MKDYIQRLWARLFGRGESFSITSPLPANDRTDPTELTTPGPRFTPMPVPGSSPDDDEQVGALTETPTARQLGQEVPPEMRSMQGTKMYLPLSDLEADQQRWYTEAEARWSRQVDLSGQDFHLLYDAEERRWVVKLGSKDGQEMLVDPPFSVWNWGEKTQALRRRLVHLFMDRNEIPGKLFVYSQKSGKLFETETVMARN